MDIRSLVSGTKRVPLLLLGFALAILPALLGQIGTVTPQRSEKNTYTLSVKVGVVVLPIAVFDRPNHPVPGLKQSDFHVFENGVPQDIALFDNQDSPVTMGIVVDNSTSMAAKRSDVVIAAMDLAALSNPRDQMFVIHFNEYVSLGLPPEVGFTSDRNELRMALAKIGALGRTALYDAVREGMDHLIEGGMRRNVLVIISDGGDNASRHTCQETLDSAVASNVLLYTIGIYDQNSSDKDPKVLKQLAHTTGGEVYFPSSSSQLPEICRRIAADIRSQYTLGYIPSNQERDGSYRKIRVTVNSPEHGKLTVRTRPGYLAPKESDDEKKAQAGG